MSMFANEYDLIGARPRHAIGVAVSLIVASGKIRHVPQHNPLARSLSLQHRIEGKWQGVPRGFVRIQYEVWPTGDRYGAAAFQEGFKGGHTFSYDGRRQTDFKRRRDRRQDGKPEVRA